ncbi:MAG TPA: hypothetical protein VGD22_06175 [Sphingobacteriaceae bacterium]
MYAALIKLTIDPQFAPQAAITFTEKILPRVKNASGFVAGYWVDPVEEEGFGFLLFESVEDAKSAAPPAFDWTAPGVTIKKFDIRRVAVSIP